VLRLEVALQGLEVPVTVSRDEGTKKDVRYEVFEDPVSEVIKFLERYSTAKIIYVVDTHAMDNGFLAYEGTTPKDYLSCSLEEVGKSNPP
jgi:capsule polysaccharide modification protein KpsS